MPKYEVPDTVAVVLNEIELPLDIPVDGDLTVKPLADCNRNEVDEAVKTFSGLVLQAQKEIETSIRKHVEIRRRVAHLQAYRENFDDIAWVREQQR